MVLWEQAKALCPFVRTRQCSSSRIRHVILRSHKQIMAGPQCSTELMSLLRTCNGHFAVALRLSVGVKPGQPVWLHSCLKCRAARFPGFSHAKVAPRLFMTQPRQTSFPKNHTQTRELLHRIRVLVISMPISISRGFLLLSANYR